MKRGNGKITLAGKYIACGDEKILVSCVCFGIRCSRSWCCSSRCPSSCRTRPDRCFHQSAGVFLFQHGKVFHHFMMCFIWSWSFLYTCRSWQASSRPPPWSRSLTSLQTTLLPSRPLSSGRKQQTSQLIQRQAARMQPEPIRAQRAVSRRCSRATTILANSLVDTPGHTTGTPGTVPMLLLHD